MPMARATLPTAFAKNSGSFSASAAFRYSMRASSSSRNAHPFFRGHEVCSPVKRGRSASGGVGAGIRVGANRTKIAKHVLAVAPRTPFITTFECECDTPDGKLYEAYTGVYHDHARDVQVDHIVAKREAHDSGACAWSMSERRAFAHDVENLALASLTLDLGVKAGRDAAEWLPDFNRCWYAGAVVDVRLKYGLTVDEAERDALEEMLSMCDSTELIFTSESWTIEEIALGDESGWQALSPNEPELDGLGVAGRMAVFCTSRGA